MNVRQRKNLIAASAALVALAGAAVLAAGLVLPVTISPSDSHTLARTAGGKAASTQAIASDTADSSQQWREDLLRLCQVDLRRDLFEVPTVAAPAIDPATTPSTAAQASSLSIRLIGTIIEPGHSMALFQKATGIVELASQGDTFDDGGVAVTVVTVEPLKVTVRRAGVSIELVIPPPAPAVAPVGGAAP